MKTFFLCLVLVSLSFVATDAGRQQLLNYEHGERGMLRETAPRLRKKFIQKQTNRLMKKGKEKSTKAPKVKKSTKAPKVKKTKKPKKEKKSTKAPKVKKTKKPKKEKKTKKPKM